MSTVHLTWSDLVIPPRPTSHIMRTSWTVSRIGTLTVAASAGLSKQIHSILCDEVHVRAYAIELIMPRDELAVRANAAGISVTVPLNLNLLPVEEALP